MELEDSFIDADDVKKNVISYLIAKAKYRDDGEMYVRDKTRIAVIEALSKEEIIYICSSSIHAILDQKKPALKLKLS